MNTKGMCGVAGVIAVCAAVLTVNDFRSPAPPRQKASPLIESPNAVAVRADSEYTTTAPALLEAYRHNWVQTQGRLAGRVIMISGRVALLEASFSDALVVMLDTGHAALPAEMQMLPAEKGGMENLSVGDEVKLRCRGVEYYLDSVTGLSCVIMP